MNTSPNDPKWTAYVLNEVTEAERQELEAELAENSEARETVEELRNLCEWIRDSFDQDPDLSLDPLQKERIQRAAQKPPRGRSQWRLPLAAAAALMIGLLGVQLSHRLSSPPATVMYESDVQVPETASGPSAPAEEESLEIEAIKLDEVAGDPFGGGAGGGGARREDRSRTSSELRRQAAVEDSNPVPAPEAEEIESLSEMRADFAPPAVKPGAISRSGSAPLTLQAVPPRHRMMVQDEMPYRSVISPSLDDFDVIRPNSFRRVADHPLSTFSIDVDTASYAVVRKFLNEGRLPPPDAVRIEEMINYFTYDAAAPEHGEAFAAAMETAPAPWKPEHQLVRISLKGREIPAEERPALNLVFLLDVSGSMNGPNRLPLVKRSMTALAKQLDERDRVAIVVYSGASGLALPSTAGGNTQEILEALNRLQAGGSTAGGAGIQLAYETARGQFREGGVNRVILCTDGDFNVGVHQRGDLERLIGKEAESGVQLSVLGFGMGNYKDSTLEILSNKGDGNYAYIDDFSEARKVLVEQLLGTLVTIARDVKIQVEFNPARVAAYRLIGYENRMLKKEDFNNDKVDAGEIGAGHQVTAFYEVVPVGVPVPGAAPEVDELKYQASASASDDEAEELLTLKIRHKAPESNVSTKQEFPLRLSEEDSGSPGREYRFSSAVAAFGLWLRDPAFREQLDLEAILERAESAVGEDRLGYRAEFLRLVRNAGAL